MCLNFCLYFLCFYEYIHRVCVYKWAYCWVKKKKKLPTYLPYFSVTSTTISFFGLTPKMQNEIILMVCYMYHLQEKMDTYLGSMSRGDGPTNMYDTPSRKKPIRAISLVLPYGCRCERNITLQLCLRAETSFWWVITFTGQKYVEFYFQSEESYVTW